MSRQAGRGQRGPSQELHALPHSPLHSPPIPSHCACTPSLPPPSPFAAAHPLPFPGGHPPPVIRARRFSSAPPRRTASWPRTGQPAEGKVVAGSCPSASELKLNLPADQIRHLFPPPGRDRPPYPRVGATAANQLILVPWSKVGEESNRSWALKFPRHPVGRKGSEKRGRRHDPAAVPGAVRGGGGGAAAHGQDRAAAGAGHARGGAGQDRQGPRHRQDARLHALRHPHVQRRRHRQDPEQGTQDRKRQPHGPGAMADAPPRGLPHRIHTIPRICHRSVAPLPSEAHHPEEISQHLQGGGREAPNGEPVLAREGGEVGQRDEEASAGHGQAERGHEEAEIRV